ncbi:MAG TPA: hypothetical protein VEB60_02555 [Candidatus Paceibacterota bacterium]|nr:hypothetical protein [Candidatus Paceibacterota bacterium]
MEDEIKDPMMSDEDDEGVILPDDELDEEADIPPELVEGDVEDGM